MAGTSIGSRDYSAFGAITTTSGTGLDRYGYTAREWDSTLNLQYTRMRMYDPATGRFTREDQLGLSAGDVNLHRYVGNAVTLGSDPSRLFWNIVIGAGIGAGVGYLGNGFNNLANGQDFNHNGWQAAVTGGFGGAVTGATFGLLPAAAGVGAAFGYGAVAGAAGGFAYSVDFQLMTKGNVDWEDVAADTAFGGAAGGVFGAAGKWLPCPQAANPEVSPTQPIPRASPFILGSKGERLTLPSNSLTASEAAEIQAIANKYNTAIDVIGSRAAGKGRNIDTNLPMKEKVLPGQPSRSDIDFRIDSAHPKASDLGPARVHQPDLIPDAQFVRIRPAFSFRVERMLVSGTDDLAADVQIQH